MAPSSRKSLALALVSDGGIKAVFGIIENLDVIFSKIVFDSDVCGVFFVFRQKKILFQSFHPIVYCALPRSRRWVFVEKYITLGWESFS